MTCFAAVWALVWTVTSSPIGDAAVLTKALPSNGHNVLTWLLLTIAFGLSVNLHALHLARILADDFAVIGYAIFLSSVMRGGICIRVFRWEAILDWVLVILRAFIDGALIVSTASEARAGADWPCDVAFPWFGGCVCDPVCVSSVPPVGAVI